MSQEYKCPKCGGPLFEGIYCEKCDIDWLEFSMMQESNEVKK